jgi:hypothetical protein
MWLIPRRKNFERHKEFTLPRPTRSETSLRIGAIQRRFQDEGQLPKHFQNLLFIYRQLRVPRHRAGICRFLGLFRLCTGHSDEQGTLDIDDSTLGPAPRGMLFSRELLSVRLIGILITERYHTGGEGRCNQPRRGYRRNLTIPGVRQPRKQKITQETDGSLTSCLGFLLCHPVRGTHASPRQTNSLASAQISRFARIQISCTF